MGKFRFNLSRDLWAAHYISEKELDASNIIKIVRDGVLRGFAVYSILNYDAIKACGILDLCADGKDVLVELIDKIIEKAVNSGVDFIFLRECEEPYDDAFDAKGFFYFMESVILAVLLNPRELLLALSERIHHGKVLKFVVEGFDPILVKVGKKGIRVIEGERSDLKVLTDSKTFLRLFFGQTSVLKEFLRGRITIDRIFSLSTLVRFFSIIKQRRWYIPSGDWT